MASSFIRRGIVEGFFGPPWSMSHRGSVFKFGAARGMNTYLYAPKDDPYHRERWTEPYPDMEWSALSDLIRCAQDSGVAFVYGFHPGKRLRFSDEKPVAILLDKARRFYDAGVRTFAVLFDDIPSHLEHEKDRRSFNHSLATAQGHWLDKILARQPNDWSDVEWWICPSYYTDDALLPRTFGSFEPLFLETLAAHLPPRVACFWTGPSIVSKKITLAHVRRIVQRVKHPLILWDNYPVNDLSMKDEMHLSPLTGRDPRLPVALYGYLNNPLLQENLSYIPLATCFDYAVNPARYDPEASWKRIIIERFGAETLPYWEAIRKFCERTQQLDAGHRARTLSAKDRIELQAAHHYIESHRAEQWTDELRPWSQLIASAFR